LGRRRTRTELEQRPDRGDLASTGGIGVTGTIIAHADPCDREVYRGEPQRASSEVQVRAALGQRLKALCVVILRRHEHRRVALRVRIVYLGAQGALE
jgi:hypothetical protein